MTKAMKPEDFDNSFVPTYARVADKLSITGEIAKPKSYILLFDNRHDEQDRKYAVELDHQLVLRLAYDILELVDPAPEYETLRTLKKIEDALKDISKISDS